MAEHPHIERFTISLLPKISSISHDDVLLVSDYDDGLHSRSMDMSQMISAVAVDEILSANVDDSRSPLGTAIRNVIAQKTAELIVEEVKKQLSNDANISALVLKTISANSLLVQDVLDGTVNNTYVIGADQEQYI